MKKKSVLATVTLAAAVSLGGSCMAASNYSYLAGRQSSVARNGMYESLPVGGTKEAAEAFYETHDVGVGSTFWMELPAP